VTALVIAAIAALDRSALPLPHNPRCAVSPSDGVLWPISVVDRAAKALKI